MTRITGDLSVAARTASTKRRGRPPATITVISVGTPCDAGLEAIARLLLAMDDQPALRALGRPGLHVVAIDPDAVSPANVGRQLFAPADVGHNKATLLVHRINAFYGLDWNALPRAFQHSDRSTHLLITCVDTRRTRAQIHHTVTHRRSAFDRGNCRYWLDLGNRAADGQMILGEPAQSERARNNKTRLPTVPELLPEIIAPGREDNTPSCSLAEALERQELFINQVVVTQALALLWQLLRHGRIDWHGAFVNARTGRSSPLPVDPAVWKRMRGQA